MTGESKGQFLKIWGDTKYDVLIILECLLTLLKNCMKQIIILYQKKKRENLHHLEIQVTSDTQVIPVF